MLVLLLAATVLTPLHAAARHNENPTVAEALLVAADQPVNDVLFPDRRKAGGINTGTEIRNLEAEMMTKTCHLMQGGDAPRPVWRIRPRTEASAIEEKPPRGKLTD